MIDVLLIHVTLMGALTHNKYKYINKMYLNIMIFLLLFIVFVGGTAAHSVAFPRIVGDGDSLAFGILSPTYGTHLVAEFAPFKTYFTEHDEFWTCKCCVRTDTIFNHIPSTDNIVEAWFFVEQENTVYRPWKRDKTDIAFQLEVGTNKTQYMINKTHIVANKTMYKKDDFLKSDLWFETHDKVQLVTGVKRCDNGISMLVPKDHDISLSKAVEYQKYLNKYYD